MTDIKKEIIDAGLYLLKQKLVARTWGNISARVNENTFYITPSGKDYRDIKKSDLALINIKDCSYDENGPKPSSEKKMHAAIYKLKDEAKYIIHTHQHYASAICAEGYSIELSDGTFVPCAKYGLPGTKKLCRNVEKMVSKFPESDIILMEKHGAVIVGKTMDHAIKRANYLEIECKKIFDTRVKNKLVVEKMDAYLDDYAQMFPTKDKSDLEAQEMIKQKNAAAQLYCINGKPLNKFDQIVQHLVYKFKYSKLKGKK